MKHIFILNPIAGKGDAYKSLPGKIMSAFKDTEDEYEIHRTMSKQEVINYCKARAEQGDHIRLYACGGDGTVNTVASAIMGHSNVELGILPCGTGNDFVRNFTNTENFLDIEKQINATVMDCDIIKTNDGYCLNMLNIGMDCDVAAGVPAAKEKYHIKNGPLSYIVSAVPVLTGGNLYIMSYEKDGETFEEELMLAAIANGKFCGGGFMSSPNAKLGDGLMDIGLVRPYKGLKLVSMLLKYRNGKHLEDKSAADHIVYFQTDKFTIRPKGDIRIAVDGEVQTFVESTFEIIPAGIKIAVPQGSEPL